MNPARIFAYSLVGWLLVAAIAEIVYADQLKYWCERTSSPTYRRYDFSLQQAGLLSATAWRSAAGEGCSVGPATCVHSGCVLGSGADVSVQYTYKAGQPTCDYTSSIGLYCGANTGSCPDGYQVDPVTGICDPGCPSAGTQYATGGLQTGGQYVFSADGCEVICSGTGIAIDGTVYCDWEYTGDPLLPSDNPPTDPGPNCVGSGSSQLCVSDANPPGCGTINGSPFCIDDLPSDGCKKLSNGQMVCDSTADSPPAPDNDDNGLPDVPGGGQATIVTNNNTSTVNIYNNNQTTVINEADDPAPTADQSDNQQALMDQLTALQNQLAALEAASNDNAPVVAAIAALGAQLSTLGQLITSIDPSADLAAIEHKLNDVATGIEGLDQSLGTDLQGILAAVNEASAAISAAVAAAAASTQTAIDGAATGIESAIDNTTAAVSGLGDKIDSTTAAVQGLETILGDIQGAIEGLQDGLGAGDCPAGYSAVGNQCALDTSISVGDCQAAFTCAGDPVQCAVAQQVHLSRCAMTESADGSQPTESQVAAALGDTMDVSGESLDDALLGSFGASCPAPVPVSLFGQTGEIDISVFCSWAPYIKPVFIALGAWRGGLTLLRGF